MKNIKKLICMLIVCTLFMASTATMGVYATNGSIGLTINGKVVKLDQPPVSENGRTLVPLRAIFESLGAQVQWDNATQTITGTKGNVTIKLTIGSKTASINGIQITLDVPAKVINGRTLVPTRFVAENLGAIVEWDSANKMVKITAKPETNTTPTKPTTPVVVDETKILAYLEAYTVAAQGIGTSVEEFESAWLSFVFGNDITETMKELETNHKKLHDNFKSIGIIPNYSQSQNHMNNALVNYGKVLELSVKLLEEYNAGKSDEELQVISDKIDEYLNATSTELLKSADVLLTETQAYMKK